MGGRYLITGAQLGNLIALCKLDADKCNHQINLIIEKQFLFDSKQAIDRDIQQLQGGKENV